MKLTIDRAIWDRGHGSMLRSDYTEKMCILGLHAVACGIGPYKLDGLSSPAELLNRGVSTPEYLTCVDFLVRQDEKGKYISTPVAETLISINDTSLGSTWSDYRNVKAGGYITSEAERERLIASIFAEHGVEVDYIN